MMNKKTDKLPDFEKALTELESLVEKLESGELALDDALSDFKRGVELTRQCTLVLNQAQQSIDKLLNPEDDSTVEPFQPDE